MGNLMHEYLTDKRINGIIKNKSLSVFYKKKQITELVSE